MGEGRWKAVRLDATTESSYADLAETGFFTTSTGYLGFEDHADGDAFTMKEVGSEKSFDGMTDCVTKVDEIAKVGFLCVIGDDGCFGVYGRDDEGEKRVRSKILEGLCVYGVEGVEEGSRGRFEEGKRVLVPDCGCLGEDEEKRRRSGRNRP